MQVNRHRLCCVPSSRTHLSSKEGMTRRELSVLDEGGLHCTGMTRNHVSRVGYGTQVKG